MTLALSSLGIAVGFTGNATVYPFKDPNGVWTWVTDKTFDWNGSDGVTYTVPALFVTDLGTVPWWMRWVLNPADPQVVMAYVLHDYLLERLDKIGQFVAAAQLYDALRYLAVPEWKRKLIVVGVVAAIDTW